MPARAWDVEDFDLFISYSRRDNADGMVTALVERIRADFARFSPAFELSVFFDQDDIRDLNDWQQRLRKGLERSKVMLAVLSPHYFASEWCRREWETYVECERARTYPGESIAPVFIVPQCDIEPLVPPAYRHWWEDLKARQGVEAQAWWPDGREALQRVEVSERLDRMEKAIAERAEFGRKLSRVPRNIRPRNEHFTGRVQELRELRETLSRFEMVGVCAVHGIGGIGKTSLAHEYAWRFRPEYLGGQFEIDLSSVHSIEELQARLVTLARDYLGSEIPLQMPLAKAFPRAKAAFERRTGGERILLVLDNLNEEDFSLVSARNRGQSLPSPESVHTLVTTRVGPGRLGDMKTVSIDALTPAEALDLLFRFREFVRDTEDPEYRAACAGDEAAAPRNSVSTEDDWKAALTIVNRLGRHTLAVELVAAYLGRHAGVTLLSFLADLEQHEIGVALDVAGRDERVRQLIAHPETLIGPLFERTLRRLPPLEASILSIAALLPPDDVPLPWIEALCRADPSLAEPLKRRPFGERDGWQPALDDLHDLRLLVRSESGRPTARIHRIVQTVVRERSTTDERKATELSLRRHLAQRGDSLREAYVLTPHSWEVRVIDRFVTARRNEPDRRIGWGALTAARGCTLLGDLLSARRLLDLARTSFTHLADIDFESSEAQRDLAASFHRIGEISTGDLTAARSFLEQGLAIRQRLTDAGANDAQVHRELSRSFHYLGHVSVEAGDLTAARGYFERCLAIRQQLSDADPHNTEAQRDLSLSIHNLGDVSVQMGDLNAARQFFEKALAIQFCLAEAYPQSAKSQRDLAVSFQRLGSVRERVGDLAAARRFFEKSLLIEQRLADADPQNVWILRGLSLSFVKLGTVSVKEGCLTAARQSFEQGLAIAQRLANADPHDAGVQRLLSIGFVLLGETMAREGRLGVARRFCEQGVAIAQQLADADPHNAEAQRNLRKSHHKMARIARLQGDEDSEMDSLRQCIAAFDGLHARGCHVSPNDEREAERTRNRLQELETRLPE